MTIWKKQKLGDICELQQGLCINRKSRHMLIDKSDLPLLRITDLINNKQEQYINPKFVPPQFISDEKSLIYTRTGQVGLVFKNRIGVVHNNCFKIIPKECLDINFLYYLLKQKRFYDNIIQIAYKSAQPDLTHTAFKSVEISLPDDLQMQARIVSILSKYDDVIKNNEKRIKILEEMAQRLYTEWFVKFKFPGYKKVKIFNSLPKNWEYIRIDDISKVIRGTSYSTEQINDDFGDYYLVNLKNFNRGGGFRYDGVKYFNGNVKEEQLLRQGDIVVAVTDMTTDRAVISRPARIPNIKSDKITFSADVVKILPEKLPLAFVYYSLLDYRFTETTKNKANGANVLHLKPQAISEYKIILPTNDLLNRFERTCGNTLSMIDKLSEENEKLAKMRDLLIPQLVTGKRELIV